MNPTTLPDRAVALLRALDIEEIEYSLSGGGDSGEAELIHVRRRDGAMAYALPDLPVIIDDFGHVATLLFVLDRVVADAPDGDWVNNEGGHGKVWVRPFADETNDEEVIECDMTYGVEDDYDDDDDEFDDDDLDGEPDDDPDDDPPAPASPSAQAGEVDQ